jgi:hypothetical protein
MACQKKKETSSLNTETTVTPEHPFFNKNVGGPIDSSMANKWKRNMALTLSKKASSAITSTAFYLPAASLRNLVAADKVAGICFYYGKNSEGKVHVLPIAVDVKGYIVKAPSVMSSNGSLEWTVAKQWTDAFKQQHPSNIWGHFWGSVAVERLLASGTDTVRVELGINDEGAQQMMFSDAAIEEPLEYGDRTRACPPFCPKD